MCVPFIRRYFQEHQFLVLLKHRNIDSVIFRNAGFEEINNHSLRTIPFQKKNCYGTFRYVSTLRKKLFFGAIVNCVFLYGSNNSDSVVFGNASFGMIKDHNLRMILFPKKIAMKVLGMCLPYVKMCFQEHQWSVFFFVAEIAQILLSSEMLVLERSKIAVW